MIHYHPNNANKNYNCAKKCRNYLSFKKIALPLHRFSSPDGGIGRRAGLKHQWGNTRAGSTPALGTALKAKSLVNIHSQAIFCCVF